MSRLRHVLRELVRNLYRNPGTAFGSVLSLMLLFLLFDLFWITTVTSDRFYRDLLSELRVELFLPEELPDSLVEPLSRSVISLDGIQSAAFVSREAAREELTRLMGTDLLVGYDSLNPLPRSLVLTIEPEFVNTADMDALEMELASLVANAEIQYSRRWLRKAETTRAVILRVGLALGVIILLATLISSANNIRLMARARAVGFQQMLLLGAGKLFVASPFLLEGFLLAGLSAAAGWGIIFYGKATITFTQIEVVVPTNKEIAVFCLLAALLGCLSGYLGIRRLLK